MTDDHVVPLEKPTGKRVADALSLGIDFLKEIRDPSQCSGRIRDLARNFHITSHPGARRRP
ncbi:MAG: hypothetical protein ABSE25_00520 [Syntrophorhabdales bacterium]|jgi:hypothetical protein